MTLPIYLAAPSAELERVEAIAARLDALGTVRVTYRWFDAVRSRAVSRDSDLTNAEQTRHAENCLAGIAEASVVWLLWANEGRSNGVPCELGYALGVGLKPVIVTGRRVRESIFTALCERHATDDAGFERVRRWAYEASPQAVVT